MTDTTEVKFPASLQLPVSGFALMVDRLDRINEGMGDGAVTTDELRDVMDVVRQMATALAFMDANQRART